MSTSFVVLDVAVAAARSQESGDCQGPGHLRSLPPKRCRHRSSAEESHEVPSVILEATPHTPRRASLP